MPRIRTIKPQFWIDEHLGSISRDARLLYIGLWNLSDDQGVFEYRPARIKVQLFPYDTDITTERITDWLNELLKVGDVLTFGTNGDTFGYIPSFNKHQQIEKPSKWHYAEIPIELLQYHSPTTPLLDGDDSPTTQQPLSLGNREKEIEKESSSSSADEDKIKIFATLYESNIGMLTGLLRDELVLLANEYTSEWFKEAVKEACNHNARNLKYVSKILERWKTEGYKNNKKKTPTNIKEPVNGKIRRYVN